MLVFIQKIKDTYIWNVLSCCFTLLFEMRWYSQSSVFHVKYCHYMSCLLFSYKRSFEMSTSFMFYSQNNIVWCFVQQYISLLSLFFHHYGCRMFLVSTKKLLFTSQWTQLLRYTHGEETSYYWFKVHIRFGNFFIVAKYNCA